MKPEKNLQTKNRNQVPQTEFNKVPSTSYPVTRSVIIHSLFGGILSTYKYLLYLFQFQCNYKYFVSKVLKMVIKDCPSVRSGSSKTRGEMKSVLCLFQTSVLFRIVFGKTFKKLNLIKKIMQPKVWQLQLLCSM